MTPVSMIGGPAPYNGELSTTVAPRAGTQGAAIPRDAVHLSPEALRAQYDAAAEAVDHAVEVQKRILNVQA